VVAPPRFIKETEMAELKIRHESVKNETIRLPWGDAQCDGDGYVTNVDDLGCEAKDLLTRAGFINATQFPVEGREEGADPVVPDLTPVEIEEPLEGEGPPDADEEKSDEDADDDLEDEG